MRLPGGQPSTHASRRHSISYAHRTNTTTHQRVTRPLAHFDMLPLYQKACAMYIHITFEHRFSIPTLQIVTISFASKDHEPSHSIRGCAGGLLSGQVPVLSANSPTHISRRIHRIPVCRTQVHRRHGYSRDKPGYSSFPPTSSPLHPACYSSSLLPETALFHFAKSTCACTGSVIFR